MSKRKAAAGRELDVPRKKTLGNRENVEKVLLLCTRGVTSR